jgi:hypothetical protein
MIFDPKGCAELGIQSVVCAVYFQETADAPGAVDAGR